MRFEAKDIAYAYPSSAPVLRSVSLSWTSGHVVFILGANGSGKTTLLECLSGLRTTDSGVVTLDGYDLQRISARARAQRIGLVPQMHEPIFEFTVEQAVLMGRAPHLGLFAYPGKQDRLTVLEAMQSVGIGHLAQRPYTKLSGGERQLTLIARGLAQGAGCLLMDEPVAHLDPHHQHDVLSTVCDLAEQDFSFAITSHLPNHALLYASKVAFLVGGKADLQGSPDHVITEENLRAAYAMEFELVQGASGSRAILPRSRRT